MKKITIITTIESYNDVSLARLLLHASRALDQQAKAEGLTAAQIVDGNLAEARLTAFHDHVDIEADAIAKPVQFNVSNPFRGIPR